MIYEEAPSEVKRRTPMVGKGVLLLCVPAGWDTYVSFEFSEVHQRLVDRGWRNEKRASGLGLAERVAVRKVGPDDRAGTERQNKARWHISRRFRLWGGLRWRRLNSLDSTTERIAATLGPA